MSESEIFPTCSFGDLVEIARSMNRDRRRDLYENHRAAYMSMDPVSYALEFKTVQIGIGRQAGKTTYLANAAKKGDLVLVSNVRIAGMLLSTFDIEANVISINTIDSYALQVLGMHHTIWVDDASFIAKDKMDHMYRTFGARASQFVLLG